MRLIYLPLLAVLMLPGNVLAEEAKSDLEVRGDQLLKADPKSILNLRERIQNISAAKQAPIQGDFEPEIPQEILNIDEIFDVTLGPDSREPKIFIARYQSSAVSFIDAYGKPWPIRKISSFLDGLVFIEKAATDSMGQAGEEGEAGKGGKGSGIDINDPQAGSFTVTALKHGVVGNITVFLVGQQTPISVQLVGKPSMYHRNATVRVQDVGPQTSQSDLLRDIGVVVGTDTDVDLNHALYGVTPSGSEEMVVEGAEGKAWLKDGVLYLRTPVAVFSPKILRSSPGNGRYRAYKLEAATEVLGTNNEGRTVVMKILRSPATAILEQGIK